MRRHPPICVAETLLQNYKWLVGFYPPFSNIVSIRKCQVSTVTFYQFLIVTVILFVAGVMTVRK